MALKHDIRFKKLSKDFSKETFKAENLVKELDKSVVLKESHNKPKKAKIDGDKATDFDEFLEERNKLFENIEEDFENTKSCYVLTMSQFGTLPQDDDKEGERSKDEVNESKFVFEQFPEVGDV